MGPFSRGVEAGTGQQGDLTVATAVSYARGAPERRVAAGDRRVQAPTGSNSSCTKEWVWQHGEFLSIKIQIRPEICPLH